MSTTASLISSYDTKKCTSQNVSIGDGKQLLIIGSSNCKVPNGILEDVFHVHGILINFLSISHACQKSYMFEAWTDKYVIKDIKHNFKVVSLGIVDHDASLYKFIIFHSSKNQ